MFQIDIILPIISLKVRVSFIPWEHYTQLPVYGLWKVGIKQKTLNTISWECTQLEIRRGGHTHWTIPGKKHVKGNNRKKEKNKRVTKKKKGIQSRINHQLLLIHLFLGMTYVTTPMHGCWSQHFLWELMMQTKGTLNPITN